MMTQTPNLSDADTRRDDIVAAALTAFAARGFFATPVTAVADLAGISQAYVFKLFPTKEALFVAAVDRCYATILATLRQAAPQGASPDQVLSALAGAYARLIADRTILMIQVHAQSAGDVPAIRAALRRGLAAIVRETKALSGATDEAIQRFMAFGQLCHLITTADSFALNEDWAVLLAQNIRHT